MKKELLQTTIRWVNQVLDSFEGGDDASEIDGKDLICELIGELHGNEWDEQGELVPDRNSELATAKHALAGSRAQVSQLEVRVAELQKLLLDTKIQNEKAAEQLRASGEELNRVNRAKIIAEGNAKEYERTARVAQGELEALRRNLGAQIVGLQESEARHLARANKAEADCMAQKARADAKTVTINLNDAVRCELTEQGKSLVMSDLSANRGGKPWSTRWQLWELFAVFGKHFPGYPRFGFAPFVDNNITFPYVPEAERVNAENVAVYVGPKP